MRSQVAFSYDGQCIDTAIAGFATLAVSGRGNFTTAVNSTDLASDGAKYLSSRIESKKLTVNFSCRLQACRICLTKQGNLKASVRQEYGSFLCR